MLAFAGLMSGCSMSDQSKLYSESAKPRATQAARTASGKSDTSRSPKSADPHIVLGEAY